MKQKSGGKSYEEAKPQATRANPKRRREDLEFIPQAPPMYNMYCFFHNWVNSLLEDKEPESKDRPNNGM